MDFWSYILKATYRLLSLQERIWHCMLTLTLICNSIQAFLKNFLSLWLIYFLSNFWTVTILHHSPKSLCDWTKKLFCRHRHDGVNKDNDGIQTAVINMTCRGQIMRSMYRSVKRNPSVLPSFCQFNLSIADVHQVSIAFICDEKILKINKLKKKTLDISSFWAFSRLIQICLIRFYLLFHQQISQIDTI